jgi:hypothetical protein
MLDNAIRHRDIIKQGFTKIKFGSVQIIQNEAAGQNIKLMFVKVPDGKPETRAGSLYDIPEAPGMVEDNIVIGDSNGFDFIVSQSRRKKIFQ